MQVYRFFVHVGFEESFFVGKGLQGEVALGVHQFVDSVFGDIVGKNGIVGQQGSCAQDARGFEKVSSIHDAWLF